MSRRGGSINRRGARLAERHRLLIVCEGAVTEVEYFQGLKQSLRKSGVAVRGVEVKGHGSDPLNVLDEARRMASEEDFDEVWVVVDTDTHERLPQALREARRARVPVVVSNPCFEIWLLWHHADCQAHQSADDLRRELRRYGHCDPKHLPPRFPYDHWPQAEARARFRPVSHTQIAENPSSAMPDLLAALLRSASGSP